MIDMKMIGENIRQERKRQLLTMDQLAEKAGITNNFLGKLERGEGMPSLPTLDSIACALGVSMDSLKGNVACYAEHHLAVILMEINQLPPERQETFLDFIRTNIKYFKS